MMQGTQNAIRKLNERNNWQRFIRDLIMNKQIEPNISQVQPILILMQEYMS